jgi:hypothetical protein
MQIIIDIFQTLFEPKAIMRYIVCKVIEGLVNGGGGEVIDFEVVEK